jgi:aminopeptidase-like protein
VQLARLWVLNLSDGSRSLLEIAERAELPYSAVERAACDLQHAGLLDIV